ncbi:hypothetical protein CDD83_6599 [Cordyceps sp. RAO-2017]|nr:hypothetical protein CDD83_6599 [Cordyceps sp. RAO-2017]
MPWTQLPVDPEPASPSPAWRVGPGAEAVLDTMPERASAPDPARAGSYEKADLLAWLRRRRAERGDEAGPYDKADLLAWLQQRRAERRAELGQPPGLAHVARLDHGYDDRLLDLMRRDLLASLEAIWGPFLATDVGQHDVTRRDEQPDQPMLDAPPDFPPPATGLAEGLHRCQLTMPSCPDRGSASPASVGSACSSPAPDGEERCLGKRKRDASDHDASDRCQDKRARSHLYQPSDAWPSVATSRWAEEGQGLS